MAMFNSKLLVNQRVPYSSKYQTKGGRFKQDLKPTNQSQNKSVLVPVYIQGHDKTWLNYLSSQPKTDDEQQIFHCYPLILMSSSCILNSLDLKRHSSMEYPHKIWPYMVQYLHFRILEFPLNSWNMLKPDPPRSFVSRDDFAMVSTDIPRQKSSEVSASAVPWRRVGVGNVGNGVGRIVLYIFLGKL